MKKILQKLKLIQHLTTVLEFQQLAFARILYENVEGGNTGLFSDAIDTFSASKKEYRGHVYDYGFEIKRRKKFFDMNMNFAKAKGTFFQQGDKLIIETEINGFHGAMIIFYIFILLFYSVFIPVMLFSQSGKAGFFIIPFILIHALFMIGIPYLIMRRSVSRMSYDLEREFHYLSRK